jgi:uncharacterized protein (DUF4415 family)
MAFLLKLPCWYLMTRCLSVNPIRILTMIGGGLSGGLRIKPCLSCTRLLMRMACQGSSAPAAQRLWKGKDMTLVIHKSKGLTPKILAELEALAAMPDDTIDLSDMPEVTDFTGWVRGKFYRPVKKQVTVRLDADVLEYFKAKQGGARGYQTAINAALRKVVEEEMRKAG